MKHLVLCLFLCWLAAAPLWGQRPDSRYELMNRETVEGKTFYLLSLCKTLPPVAHLLAGDPVLKDMATRKCSRLEAASGRKQQADALHFSAEEIRQVSDRLAALYAPDNALGDLYMRHILPSGAYILYAALPPVECLRKAWEQDAAGVNRTLDVFACGVKPAYPEVDSMSFYTGSKEWAVLFATAVENITEMGKSSPLFFSIPLTAALTFLDVNDRNRAADYEPLSATVNRQGYEAVARTDWERYPYSLILVLGEGPEVDRQPISPGSRLRCQYAAELYFRGMAPFVMVSGGKVHPWQTPYCEAEEMARYLRHTCHVPASAILWEPHARHTTTNVRNAVRIMFREGFPMEKAALITSSAFHIAYVAHPAFQERCLADMGVEPCRLGKQLSPRAIEFYPRIEALQVNPLDPLDP